LEDIQSVPLIKAAESEYFKQVIQNGKHGFIPCSQAEPFSRKIMFDEIMEYVFLPSITPVSL